MDIQPGRPAPEAMISYAADLDRVAAHSSTVGPCEHAEVDREWVAVSDLVLAGLRDGYSFDDPPKTDVDLEWLAATVTDHVIAGVVPRPENLPRRRRWLPFGGR